MRLLIFFLQQLRQRPCLVCVVALGWTHTHCCHRKELISYPAAGETRRLCFLAYCHTLEEKRSKLSDCPTSAQPRLSCRCSSPVSSQLLALRGRPAPRWFYLVFQPLYPGGCYCLLSGCRSPQKSSSNPP